MQPRRVRARSTRDERARSHRGAPRLPRGWSGCARSVACPGLPLAGVEEHFDGFWAIDAVDGRLAGVAGAERYGPTWLLRSLVVDPAFRAQGIGTALLAAVLGEARQLDVRHVFLLTTDAHDFFAARGFIAVARSAAPSALLASEELRGACPDTATLMRLEVAR